MEQKGQIAIEHLLILGMLIIIVIPLVIIIYTSTRDTTETATEVMLNQVCAEIASKAESMQKLGPNSWTTLDLEIPANVVDIGVQRNEIKITYTKEGGESSVVCFSDVDLDDANFGAKLNEIEPGGRAKLKVESMGTFVCVSGLDGVCVITQCNDGIDNDGDGCIDRDDAGCYTDGVYNSSIDDESRAGCIIPICGNNVVEGDEYCDGSWEYPNQQPADCAGYLDHINYPSAHGELKCGPDCTAVPDTTGCGWCGDGRISGLYGEECDFIGGSAFYAEGRITDCKLHSPCIDGFGGDKQCTHGTVSCNPQTCIIDYSGCWYQYCGNDIREGTEQCDGTDAAQCPGKCNNCFCPTGDKDPGIDDPVPLP